MYGYTNKYPSKTFYLKITESMYKAVKVKPFGDKRGIVALTLSALFGRQCVIDNNISEEVPLSIRNVGAFPLSEDLIAVDTNSRIYEGIYPDAPVMFSYPLYLPMDVDNWYMTEGKYKASSQEYKNIYALYYPEKIEGKYIKNWFSNFDEMSVPIKTSDGLEYHTVENYYQAMKSTDFNFRRQVAEATPSKAKQLGKAHSMGTLRREDWFDINNKVMYKALSHKYTKCPEHYTQLLLHAEPIVELNNWNDTYWGVFINGFTGENRLGRMIMHIRRGLVGEVPF